jgi:hypothetical protein
VKKFLKKLGIDPESDREFKAQLEDQRLVSHDGTEINRRLAAHMLLKSQSVNEKFFLWCGLILTFISIDMFVSSGGSYILASGMLALGALLLGLWFLLMDMPVPGYVFSAIFGDAAYNCLAEVAYVAWGWHF